MKNIFPHYTQLDLMDCGPTCLRMIAKFYGRNFSLQFLREQCFITRLGVSMLGISDAAEHIGFRTMYVRSDFGRLVKEAPLPCVLHWNQNHFVVCYGIKRKKSLFSGRYQYKIKIADPMGEKYEMDETEFKRCWISTKVNGKETGTALLLTPSPEFYEYEFDDDKRVKGFRYFFSYLVPHKAQFLQLMAGMLIGTILSLIAPFLTQSIVDQGIGNNDLDFITLILIAQVIICVTSMLVGFIQSWISLYVNAQINISLISDFLSKLMKLPLRFFDTKNIGDILQRIGDHDRIEDFLTGSSLTTFFSLANFFIFGGIMAYYNMEILTVFLIGNIFYVVWILLFMRYRRKLDYRRFAQASAEQGNLFGLITCMQDIKLNNCEHQQRWKWERIQIKLFKIGVQGVTLGQIQTVGSLFFSQITYVSISYISAKLVVNGEITLGMMMAISYIIGQLSGPIGQFLGLTHSLQDAKISLERLNEIHNKEDEEENISDKLAELPVCRDICFKNVSFSYSGSERDYVLDNLSLKIPHNKVTAIVGVSGSGKTTIVKLLLGFYTIQKGEITIGDILLDSINPHLWRRKVGAVLQESTLFSDTIAYNIAPGEENIDKKRLVHAAQLANIKDFIDSLPLKYNTKIGMEGSGVSQGQRQRLLIARAIYKNPDFMFLDEATNSLDSINEKTIINNLNQVFENKTVVIIAHRLSTVKFADNIIVLDKGGIIEEGNHRELIEKKGEYYNLIKNQLELDA
ncbi:peptidase domain-containing ABC transporter [Bacteroides sp. GM023]|uniref:peptidase domain-containing ABC transporter n=1 Tax=Bacteroides sp. GM023 TaxID=2723058 RepID=UPI00168BA508|nr:peptidase domain-containing ABC transporter [Bacteroides sp. GM023]MBD3587942.1 peptidase domain-containing ABC transporter [Bacteroides sp. GM023]